MNFGVQEVVMTLLEAVGAWFEAQELGELGVDLFLQDRPSRPVEVTTLYLEGGESDAYRPVRQARVRCAVRAESLLEAQERAEAIFDRLHQRENFPLGAGWWCYLAQGRQTPAPGKRTQPGALTECVFRLVVRAMPQA